MPKHMDKIEKELKFQNTGLVSEKTIISVAERLGAKFIVFGKLEEFNGSYILRVDYSAGRYRNTSLTDIPAAEVLSSQG